MSKSNIFNRQSNAATLPDTINISDSISSLSTSSEVTTSPSLISTGSAVIEKDLKVDDIAYFNECRINTLRSANTKPGQGFLDYVSLTGQKIDNKNVLSVNGNLKTTDIEAEDLMLKKNKSSKTFFAAPNAQAGAPTFRAIEASDIPALEYAPKFRSDLTQKTFYAAPNAATGAPSFRAIEVSDIPALNYALPFTDQKARTVYAGPILGANNTPKFRYLITSDLGVLEKNEILASELTPSSMTNTFSMPTVSSIITYGTELPFIPYPNMKLYFSNPGFGPIIGNNIYYIVQFDLENKTLQLSSTLGGNAIMHYGSAILSAPSSFSYYRVSARSMVTDDLPSSVYGTQTKNTVYAGPSTGTTASAPSFRALVTDDLPNTILNTSTTQNSNKIFAGPSSGSSAPPTFRSIVAEDFGTVLNPSTQIKYLGVSPAGGIPSWQNLDSATIQAMVEGIIGAFVFVSVPMFPLQNKNLVFASSKDTNNQRPGFRALDVADLPSTIITTKTKQVAKKILAGPISGNDAEPTWRPLELTDLPSAVQTSASIPTTSISKNHIYASPGNADGVPSFRPLEMNDIPGEITHLITYTEAHNAVYAGPAYDFISFASITPNTTTKVFTVTGNIITALQIQKSKVSFNKVLGGIAVGTAHRIHSYTSTTFSLVDDTNNGYIVTPANNTAVSNINMVLETQTPIFRKLEMIDMPEAVISQNTLVNNLNTQLNGLRSQKLFYAGPITGTPAAPTYRAIEGSDLPGYPNGRTFNIASSAQFLGSAYYNPTSWSFNMITLLIPTPPTPITTIQLHSNLPNSAAVGTTPAYTGQLGSNVLSFNTGIQFNLAFSGIIKDQTYYIKSFAKAVENNITIYSIQISDNVNGNIKQLTAFPSGTTSVSARLIISNFPTMFRQITSNDVRTVVSSSSAPNPAYDPNNPDSAPTIEEVIDQPSNIAILDQTQNTNQVLAAPHSSSGIPLFRSLVAADIPDLSLTYAPKSGSPNYAPTFTSQNANTFFASPNGSVGEPSFRTIVAEDIPALNYAPSIVGNQLLNTDANQTINAAIHTFTIWSSGASATARTFNVINLIPGRRVMISLYNFWSAAKTISFTASATDTIGSAPFMSKGDAGGVNTSSVTLVTNGVATIQLFNAGGVIRGSIG